MSSTIAALIIIVLLLGYASSLPPTALARLDRSRVGCSSSRRWATVPLQTQTQMQTQMQTQTRIVEKFHVTRSGGLNLQILCTPGPAESIRVEERKQNLVLLALTRIYEKTLGRLYPLPPPVNAGKRLLPPLLFVHGSFHSSWCFAENFMPHFASLGYCCYALSLRGTGPTGMSMSDNDDNQESIRIEQHVEDISEALSFIQAEYNELNNTDKVKPVLIAHSFGGLIAQKMLESESIRRSLAGVCLLCSVPPSGNGPMSLRFAKRNLLTALKIVYGFVFKAATFDPAVARELFFTETISGDEGTAATAGGGVSDDAIERYMSYFRRDSKVGVDLAKLAPVLPSKTSMDESTGRASWLGGNGSEKLRFLVVGGDRDFIIDEEGTRETARYLGVEPTVLPVYHDLMLGPRCSALAASCIQSWLAAF